MHNDLPEDWEALSFTAWRVRDNAMAVRTKVGAAVLARRENGSQAIFGGCNIEDLWKAPSIHTERTAIACMVAGGRKRIEKKMLIGFQSRPSYEVQVFAAAELMPHYPF